MPLIYTLFSGLFVYFGKVATVRLGVFMTYLAATLAIYAAIVISANAAMQTLYDYAVSLNSASFAVGLSLLPSNITTCFSIITSAHLSVFLLRYKDKLISMAARIGGQ